MSEPRVRVLVDATMIKPVQGGIKTYTMELVAALATSPVLDVAVASNVPDEFGQLSGVTPIPTSTITREPLRRAAWRETRLPGLIRRTEAQAVVSPTHELPLRRLSVPTVMVVHDVGPLCAPGLYGRGRWLRYATALRRAVELASAVVCVSHATLLDLHSTLRVAPSKCHVIPEAPRELPGGANGRIVEGDYFLYVGSTFANKNLGTLLDALALDGHGPRLVATGPVNAHERGRFERESARRGIAHRVEHRGFVDARDLPALYRDAVGLVLPSLHEGFGLPVVEAMRAGSPVVASDIPAIREVAGDAALLVDRPLNPAAWHAALARVAGDKRLRARLRQLGARRAAEFTVDAVTRGFERLLVDAVRA